MLSPDPSYPHPDEQHDPNHNDARQLFADVLHHVDQRELERAAQLLEQLPFEALDATSTLSARALALQLAIDQARYNDAMVHAAAALDLTEEEPLVYHLLGQALWATGDIRTGADAIVRAAELLQTLEATNQPMQLPLDPLSVYFMAGEACQYYEQYQAALDFFYHAQRHTPTNEATSQAIEEVQATLNASKEAA